MRAVVVEDEYAVAQMFISLLDEVEPALKVVAQLQSIEESVNWFTFNPAPDVVFMDIHLADGSSFAIFDKVEIRCPIIFTTAYDEYALKAFKVNSIDYLLKPVSKTDLRQALDKLKRFNAPVDSSLLSGIMESFRQTAKPPKSHFLVAYKDKLIPLAVNDIAFFYTENKIVRANTFDGKSFLIEHTLEELAAILDSNLFYRANRQFIIAHSAITDMSLWFSGKLVVNLKIETPEKVTVSKNRVGEFKVWFTR
jgi:two-component system LytT family response regulator